MHIQNTDTNEYVNETDKTVIYMYIYMTLHIYMTYIYDTSNSQWKITLKLS